jgi:hypothetical protein
VLRFVSGQRAAHLQRHFRPAQDADESLVPIGVKLDARCTDDKTALRRSDSQCKSVEDHPCRSTYHVKICTDDGKTLFIDNWIRVNLRAVLIFQPIF